MAKSALIRTFALSSSCQKTSGLVFPKSSSEPENPPIVSSPSSPTATGSVGPVSVTSACAREGRFHKHRPRTNATVAIIRRFIVLAPRGHRTGS